MFSAGILDELRVREKLLLYLSPVRTALAGRALRFRWYLLDLIELNRKSSLSYTEDSVSENRTKMA